MRGWRWEVVSSGSASLGVLEVADQREGECAEGEGEHSVVLGLWVKVASEPPGLSADAGQGDEQATDLTNEIDDGGSLRMGADQSRHGTDGAARQDAARE